MSREHITVREFTADQAGERVGWISTEERSGQGEGREYTILDIAVGTIGENGARVGYIDLGSGQRGYTTNSVEGFIAASALKVIVPHETAVVADPSQLSIVSGGHRNYGYGGVFTSDAAMRGASEVRVHDDSAEWHVASALPSELQKRLSECGLVSAYPVIYYALNSVVLHEEWRAKDAAGLISISDLAMPDVAMQDQTLSDLQNAESIVESLGSSILEDTDMEKRLTVFSDAKPEKIPDLFVDSRRKVTESEITIIEATKRMTFAWGTFLPVGYRPSGRTWPYMDPITRDENVAFGRELEELRQGRTDIPTYELRDELKELDKRLRFAQQGRMVFALLGAAESRAA